MLALNQSLNDFAADESGAPGDNALHNRSTFPPFPNFIYRYDRAHRAFGHGWASAEGCEKLPEEARDADEDAKQDKGEDSGFMTRSPWLRAILSVLLIAAPTGFAQDSDTGSHEALDYQVEWRLIPAGTAKLSWVSMPHSAIAASEARLHLESAGLVSRLFHVDDDYTTMLGQNFCAESTLLTAHEGNRNRETRVNYDVPARKAQSLEKDLVKNTTITNQVDIPACVHDVIGGLMMLRTLNIEPGKTVQIPISDGKKFAQVKVEAQRREDLSTPLGMRKTIRYEVFLFDNVIYKRSGHLHIWLTDDNMRLPVQIQVRLQFAIGTITLRLEKESRS
jgi:hypothetical protein